MREAEFGNCGVSGVA